VVDSVAEEEAVGDNTLVEVDLEVVVAIDSKRKKIRVRITISFLESSVMLLKR